MKKKLADANDKVDKALKDLDVHAFVEADKERLAIIMGIEFGVLIVKYMKKTGVNIETACKNFDLVSDSIRRQGGMLKVVGKTKK